MNLNLLVFGRFNVQRWDLTFLFNFLISGIFPLDVRHGIINTRPWIADGIGDIAAIGHHLQGLDALPVSWIHEVLWELITIWINCWIRSILDLDDHLLRAAGAWKF